MCLFPELFIVCTYGASYYKRNCQPHINLDSYKNSKLACYTHQHITDSIKVVIIKGVHKGQERGLYPLSPLVFEIYPIALQCYFISTLFAYSCYCMTQIDLLHYACMRMYMFNMFNACIFHN